MHLILWVAGVVFLGRDCVFAVFVSSHDLGPGLGSVGGSMLGRIGEPPATWRQQ